MKQLETTSMVLLHHHLKALRLPTITAECEKLARQAAADNADHLTYLLQLCELELLERERKAAERRLKAAHFPTLKSLESFDFSARPSVNRLLIGELARCEYIDRRENVLFVGNPGTGKTHLAISLAMAACSRGYRVRFFRLTELATLLMEARDERGLLGLRARLAKLDLLILDELGYVPASKIGAELLFDVISSAYERTSLIVTTNLPFESWTEVFGDVDNTATRALLAFGFSLLQSVLLYLIERRLLGIRAFHLLWLHELLRAAANTAVALPAFLLLNRAKHQE